ncbi:MAG: hypothetical protein ACOYN0_12895, partial [Phycisphaerales bacterium]
MRRLLKMIESRRKGSVLVIVIGVLALVSVLAIVYVSIGRGDTRTRAGVVKQNSLERPPAFMRDYIAGIIADDATSTYWDQVKGLGDVTPSLTREASDSPYVLPQVISIWDGRANDRYSPIFRFNPVGDFAIQYGDDNFSENNILAIAPPRDPDPAREFRFGPSDPWLAPVLPTRLNYNHDLPANPYAIDEPYLTDDARDWLSISNIAPDGLFVNLWNLRGNFEAATGFNAGGMSYRLSLIDDLSAAPGSGDNFGRLNSGTDETDFDDETGQPVRVNTPEQVNRPFYWTMRQRNAFRSAAVTVNDAPFGSAAFKNYSFADADGDGFLDSRWFQMTDSGLGTLNARKLFETDDGLRWFFAARIVDLSALVNLNTAGDEKVGGTRETKIGSPADIDLLSLLSGVHFFERFAPADANGNQPNPDVFPGWYNGAPNRLTSFGGPVEDQPDYYGPQTAGGLTTDLTNDIDGGADRLRSWSVAR